MKRIVMFSLTLTVVLAASCAFAVQQDFAGMLGEVTIGVNVPSNWDAVKATTANTANDANVPCISLTDKSDTNRWFWIFLADEEDAEGHSLTLRQVGNNMLAGYRNRGAVRVDDGNTNGYYSLEYYPDTEAQRFILTDSDYDSRIKAGRYLSYQYTYDALEPSEVNAIISSITLDGQGRSGSSGQTTGGGTSGETGGRTDSGTTTNTISGGGGGGGGCSAGTGTLSLLALGIAFIARKSR